MKEFRTLAIAIPIWGLIQAALVFAVDRQPGPTVLWFLIFVALTAGFFLAVHLKMKLSMWMVRKWLKVPIYQRWLLRRYERMKRGRINPLHGIALGFGGLLVGPIFGICISQWFHPQTPGFRAAWIGMLVAVTCMSALGVTMFAVRNLFVRPR